MGYTGKIMDMHTHFSIETTKVAEDAKDIGFAVENKSMEEHLAFMDRLGIDFSLLSCPTQKYLKDEQLCIAYCRQVNDAGARAAGEHKDRFGFAAALPLPWVDAAIAELHRAFTELGAMAVGMCSNFDGMYLGDSRLDLLYEQLNAYKAAIILHPAVPPVYPKGPVTGEILPMYEFITDTTRTVLDMFASEVLVRYPDIKLVVPHSGSCLPIAFDRFHGIMRSLGRDVKVPLDNVYFDLACDSFPRGVKILLNLTDAEHIVYGTDFPAIPEFRLKMHLESAKNCEDFKGHMEDVLWNTPQKLLRK